MSLITDCGHSFCAKCMIGAWSQTIQHVSRRDELIQPFKQMSCPMCRANVDLPSEYPHERKKTFFMREEIAMRRHIDGLIEALQRGIQTLGLPADDELAVKYGAHGTETVERLPGLM